MDKAAKLKAHVACAVVMLAAFAVWAGVVWRREVSAAFKPCRRPHIIARLALARWRKVPAPG